MEVLPVLRYSSSSAMRPYRISYSKLLQGGLLHPVVPIVTMHEWSVFRLAHGITDEQHVQTVVFML